jgi:hypothetical protein
VSTSEKKSAATILVDIAEWLYEFGISDSGETFGVPRKGPKVVLLLRGGHTSLRAQLARVYRYQYGKVAPKQALVDALLTLDGFAQDAQPQRLWQRVGHHNGALWLDLGDHSGRAVQITGEGWKVVDKPPVLFRRTILTGPLPEPAPVGDLEELWDWLNVTKADRPLILAELVDSLWPDHPHVTVGLFGEQGTGKSTTAKILVSLIDPSPVPLRKPPRDAESWVTAAAGSWVVALDNMSTVPEWLSDSICRASTGDGDVRRKLYTDGELATFAFRRCVVLTGIDLGALNGDLAERLLPVVLEPINEADRRDEEDIWPRWSEAHPRLLGALLGLVAGVKAIRPSVEQERKPRMADYARTLAAVDQVLGTTGLDRYTGTQSRLAADSLTGDPFVIAIVEALTGTATVEQPHPDLPDWGFEEVTVERFDTFTGSAAELLARVTPTADGWRPPKGWPTTARSVTQRLHRQAAVMRKAGWVVFGVEDAHRKVTVWTITPPAPEGGTSLDHGADRPPLDPHDPQDSDNADTADYPGGVSGGAQHSTRLASCTGECGQQTLRYGPGGSPLCPDCQRKRG